MKHVLNQAEVQPLDDRVEQRAALRVLAPMFVQVVVLLDVGLECSRLIVRGECFPARRKRLEVHLRRVAGNVNEIVGGGAVAVHVAREDVARVAVGVGVEERGDRRAAKAEVLAGGGGGGERAAARGGRRGGQRRSGGG